MFSIRDQDNISEAVIKLRKKYIKIIIALILTFLIGIMTFYSFVILSPFLYFLSELIFIFSSIRISSILKKSYFRKKFEIDISIKLSSYQDPEKKQDILKRINDNFLKEQFNNLLTKNSQYQKIKDFRDIFQLFITQQKRSYIFKYEKACNSLLQMLKDEHPFECYIIEPHRELMRFVFKILTEKILLKSVNNLTDMYLNKQPIPTMEDIFKKSVKYLPITSSKNFNDVQYGSLIDDIIDDLIVIIKKTEEIPVIKSLNLNIDYAMIQSELRKFLPKDEVRRRIKHIVKDTFNSYKDLYSKYELILNFLGYILDTNITKEFEKLNGQKHYPKRQALKKRSIRTFENISNWKIFIDFAKNKKKSQLRHLNAHGNMKRENNEILGWFKDPNMIISVDEFIDYRKELTLLLWMVYEVLNIDIPYEFFESFLLF